jgi:hypothetical protein
LASRQIHVVSAEQDVLPHRDAPRLEPPLLLGQQDRREVGGAPADVDDQHHVAQLELAAPGFAPLIQPGVERCLRLLQQREMIEPCGERRLDRGLARRGVEGRRHGQHDILLTQPHAVTARGGPGLRHVIEQPKRGLDGRDLRDVFRRRQRQEQRMAIDRRRRQPALRARDHARRCLGAPPARVCAHGVRCLRQPGQRQRALARVREVDERRQEQLARDAVSRDELSQPLRLRTHPIDAELRLRQRAVRRT